MFCPNCGTENASTDNFCVNCGAKIAQDSTFGTPAPKAMSQNQAPYRTMSLNQPYNPYNQPYNPYNQPYNPYNRPDYHFGKEIAPLIDRIVAYFIDGAITSALTCMCYCPGIFYSLFKDGLSEGRSVGKNALGLRVVRFDTGMPATYGDSCVRNCCNCCPIYLCIDPMKRHVGDHIAGTIVIKDK